MAATLKQTYTVQNLGAGPDGKIMVSLSEQVDLVGAGYAPAGTVTLIVDADGAKDYLPGTVFELSLTKKA